MCTYWCNSSSAALPLLSDPEDYESSELGRLSPYDCVRAMSSVARGGKLWLRVQLPGSTGTSRYTLTAAHTSDRQKQILFEFTRLVNPSSI